MPSILLTVLLLVGLSTSAYANPPKEDSEDWLILHDYADWIINAHAPGANTSCCGVSDGRPLFEGEWKEASQGHYLVFISRRHWDNAPVQGFWLEVPSDAVLSASPVGVPIVWWYPVSQSGSAHGLIFCFAPVGGV